MLRWDPSIFGLSRSLRSRRVRFRTSVNTTFKPVLVSVTFDALDKFVNRPSRGQGNRTRGITHLGSARWRLATILIDMGLINPDQRRAYQREYYRRKDQRTRKTAYWRRWKTARRERVFARDRFTCHYCGQTRSQGAALVIDHKVPLARGGSDTDTNKLTSCWSCNRQKGTKSYELFLAEQDPNREPTWVTDEEPDVYDAEGRQPD